MMSRLAATVITATAFMAPWSAIAQPVPDRVQPDTILHLSATASVQVAPDLLVADLMVQSVLSSAAAAQRHVNATIADAMKAAQAVAGVDARATGYSVSPGDEKQGDWTVQQTLELRGSDGPVLLDLVGHLQERGLAATSIDWQLSPDLRRTAHDQAMTAALRDLQGRAASAATTLGLQVDHLQDVRLDASGFQPRRPMPMLGMRAMAAPQATATPETVEAEVAADVLLRPAVSRPARP